MLSSGQDLIDSSHYASDDIVERCEELSESWEQLLESAAERKEKLAEALESQKVNELFFGVRIYDSFYKFTFINFSLILKRAHRTYKFNSNCFSGIPTSRWYYLPQKLVFIVVIINIEELFISKLYSFLHEIT